MISPAVEQNPPQDAPPRAEHDLALPASPFSTQNVLSVLRQGWMVVVLCLALSLGAAAYYLTALTSPTYQASVLLRFSPSVLLNNRARGFTLGDAVQLQTDVIDIRSRPMIRRFVNEADLIRDPTYNPRLDPGRLGVLDWVRAQRNKLAGIRLPTDDAGALSATVSLTRSMVTAKFSGYDELLRVSVRGSDPDRVRDLANQLAALYLRSAGDVQRLKTLRVLEWLETKSQALKQDFDALQEQSWQSLQDSSDLQQKAVEAGLRLRGMEQRLQQAERSAVSVQAQIDTLQDAVTQRDFDVLRRALPEPEATAILSDAAAGVSGAETKLVAYVDQQTAALKSELSDLRDDVAIFGDLLQAARDDSAQIAERAFERAALQQQIDTTQTLYGAFVSGQVQSELLLEIDQSDKRILEAASRGEQIASKPILTTLLHGVLISARTCSL